MGQASVMVTMGQDPSNVPAGLAGLIDRVLSWSGAVPTVLAFAIVVGLVFWLVGKRFAKPGAALVGALAGAVLAVTIVDALPGGQPDIQGAGVVGERLSASAQTVSISPGVALPIGIITGAVVGLLLNRAAGVASMALVGGSGLALCAAGVLAVRPLNEAEQRAAQDRNAQWRSELTSLVGQARQGLGGVTDGASPWNAEALADAEMVANAGALLNHAGSVDIRWSDGSGRSEPRIRREWSGGVSGASNALRSRVGELTDGLAGAWGSQPAGHRAVLIMTGVLGIAGGIVLGLIKPAVASAAGTAMLGAALWLFGVAALSGWLNAPWSCWLDRSAVQWVSAWGVAAALGMCVQWSGVLTRRRSALSASKGPSRA